MSCNRVNLNICSYTPIKMCDEFGVNARFNILFKEVCFLKSTPYILPIASNIILGGIRVGTGLHINASTGVLSTTDASTFSPLSITQVDFQVDGKTYLNSDINGNISIFWNDVNRFIYESNSEWRFVAGGIQILMPGFDATTNNYNLEIFIK